MHYNGGSVGCQSKIEFFSDKFFIFKTANEKQGWWDGFTQRGALTSESDDIELAFVGTSVDDFALEFVK